MKRLISGLIIVSLIIVTGCTILPWVKDINNIKDWISVPAEDTEYEYEEVYRVYYSGELQSSDTDYYSCTVEDVDNKSDKIVIEMRFDYSGNYDTGFLIVDVDEGIIASSDDKYFDEDNDMIILATPVEEGNDWLVFGDILFEIDEMNASKEVEAGSYSDCIVIVGDGDYHDFEIWYSPSAGTIVYMIQTSEYGYGYEYRYITELRDIN